MRIGFLVSDLGLSGGVNVVLKHASYLASVAGNKVVIITQREHSDRYSWNELDDKRLSVVDLATAQGDEFDLILATWWETVFNVFSIPSGRYAWFCQSLEHRFYRPDDLMHSLAQCVETIPIPCITESTWIREQMLQLNPTRKVWLARNGIDKAIFRKCSDIKDRDSLDPIRLLVEGNINNPTKGVRDALDGIFLSTAPFTVRHITGGEPAVIDTRYKAVIGPLSFEDMAREYSWCDVLVKTSRVEGMFGPPLEAFHCGATAIVTPVTGHEEYIHHGLNALVVEWDNPRSIATAIDRLYLDPPRLRLLKAGAIKTASNWPSWEESSQRFKEIIESMLNTEVSLQSDDLRTIVNGIRGVRVSMHKSRTLLLGFVKVADERLELIRALELEIQSRSASRKIRLFSRIKSRLKRILIKRRTLLKRKKRIA